MPQQQDTPHSRTAAPAVHLSPNAVEEASDGCTSPAQPSSSPRPLAAAGAPADPRPGVLRQLDVRTFRRAPDFIGYLAHCSDLKLVLVQLVVRWGVVGLMLFCHYVLPHLFRVLGVRSLTFDSCELLYADQRFTAVRNWDGVHFFHIAAHGYSHENLLAFFPFIPMLIRAVTHVSTVWLPLLHRIAPVSFYMTCLNVLASSVAGVVLRRLTILTFLGPEALALIGAHEGPYWPSREAERVANEVADDGSSSPSASPRAADDEVPASPPTQRLRRFKDFYRVGHNVVGTMLDELHPLVTTSPLLHSAHARHGNNNNSGAGGGTGGGTSTLSASLRHETQVDLIQRHRLRWRTVGAAVFLWIVTPATVFTVAVYTESFFSLWYFAGIYCLAYYAPVHARGKRYSAACRCPYPAAAAVHPIDWRQAYTSRSELLAVAFFFTAATVRSNAFVCVGYLLYPTFLQLCFPATYRRRWEVMHGRHWAAHLEKHQQPQQPEQRRAPPSDAAAGDHKRETREVVYTRYLPRRWPHPLRLATLLLECAIIFAPYSVMNYLGWRSFVPMWTDVERAAIGRNFFKFYPAVQRKHWNVGFLSAYTIANSPNVLVALPIASLFVVTAWAFYLKPAWLQWRSDQEPPRLRNAQRSFWCVAAVHDACRSFLALVEQLVQSSSVVHLAVMFAIGFTLMHVQVTNRFVIANPALYWLVAQQLVSQPYSKISRITVLLCIEWTILGALMFANHMPWT